MLFFTKMNVVLWLKYMEAMQKMKEFFEQIDVEVVLFEQTDVIANESPYWGGSGGGAETGR